jgi:hypothetical protein
MIPASSVRIKLAGSAGNFAQVDIHDCEDVADVAEAACKKFTSWRADADQVRLFAVPPDRVPAIEEDSSTAEDILRGTPLFSGLSITEARISMGSFLLASIARRESSCRPSVLTAPARYDATPTTRPYHSR